MNRLLDNQKISRRPRRHSTRKLLHVPVAKGFSHLRNKTPRLKKLVISGLFHTHRLHFITGGTLLTLFVIFLATGIIPLGKDREKLNDTKNAITASMSASVSEPLILINSTEPETSADAAKNGEILGTGVHVVVRENDLVHTVEEGETLSEIARFYNVSIENLTLYNNLQDPNAIYIGKRIFIPSYAHEKDIQPRPVLQNTQLSVANNLSNNTIYLPKARLFINAEKEFNGLSLKADFNLSVSRKIELQRYIWHLGNGLKSYQKESSYTYQKPGTYKVYLESYDTYGRTLRSNELFIDVPYPYTYADSGHRFLTINNVGESFILDGNIVSVKGHENPEDIFQVITELENGGREYLAMQAGYFACTVEQEDLSRQVFLFISPIESVHTETNTLNWYRTQFNTGTLGNCGPATVSMAAAWAKEKYVPVINIRQAIGWRGDGGTNFDELISVMGDHGVTATQQHIQNTQDIFDIIDNGNIAIVLFHTGGISEVKGDPSTNFFGKYYPDAVGHYVIIKGYSTDKNYFIVQDPIPSDWGSNSKRYNDGISMIGRNRYYKADELLNSLRVKVVIKVTR